MHRLCTIRFGLLIAVLSIVSLAQGIANGQSFPAKPVELIVPFVAGQAPDSVARALAEGMSKHLGQQVLVVNRPGAGGAIGYKYALSRKPDGYSIVLSSNSISTGYYSGMMPSNYTAFDCVARVTLEFPVLAVRADVPFKNMKDFVENVRAHPGKVRVGSTSIGSHMHLTLVAFFNANNLQVNAIPFSTTSHIVSLLGGDIDAVVTLTGSVSGQTQAGKIRILGVLGSAREPLFPDIPTATEQGFTFQSDLWRGINVPKGAPREVIERLEESIRVAVASPEFKKLGDTVGFSPAYLGSDAFAKMLVKDDAHIGQVMAKAGLRTVP
jgi:tripartite-type tricarboxylate transporter receptor subunit TctC